MTIGEAVHSIYHSQFIGDPITKTHEDYEKLVRIEVASYHPELGYSLTKKGMRAFISALNEELRNTEV